MNAAGRSPKGVAACGALIAVAVALAVAPSGSPRAFAAPDGPEGGPGPAVAAGIAEDAEYGPPEPPVGEAEEAAASPATSPDAPGASAGNAPAAKAPVVPKAAASEGTKSAAKKKPSSSSKSRLPRDPDLQPFEILGEKVEPGKTRRMFWPGIESFVGAPTETPVVVAHGVQKGAVLCITAAIHGDEFNGIEIARRVLFDLDPRQLAGTLVGVPIVNVPGFGRSSRYLPDRRDLNRFFPGNPAGSSASRMANFLFENIIRRCDYLVDLHTGSFHRANLTQLRADLTQKSVRELAARFSPMPVLHTVPALGTLRRAAVDAGIPTVTVEAGEPLRLEVKMVEEGVRMLLDVMGRLDMLQGRHPLGGRQQVFFSSTWVRAARGGILISEVELGQKIRAGEQIASITDPINNTRAAVYATYDGVVLGIAANQFVMPGFAVLRIGIPADARQPVAAADDAGSEDEEGQGRDGDEPDEGGSGDEPAAGSRPSLLDPDWDERPE